MTHFLYYSLLSFYYNFYVQKQVGQRSMTEKLCAHWPSPDQLFSCFTSKDRNLLSALYQSLPNIYNMNHDASLCDDTEEVTEAEEEEEEEDEDDELDMETRCSCGIILSNDDSWSCDNCRVSCSGCNRSLVKGFDEYCTRCYYKCQKHGLIPKSAATDGKCPACSV
ncbi:hypothetical protein BDF20DRAFT_870361 [Mycotypha africana]|uniref:uncharacterized protein n=1 Tax=Mycotypha africana TaxID=64632 RepID=UPI00230122D5|nr:uncharacterized protein BDF20DRAFT_870361 [Mycotypha africana]KAI8979571.1 hypothetical protein BDF20DRAFT_870361 [Mycotypha africana]